MNKQIKIGLVLQYVQMALGIVISLIYTPIMLKILGQSEYGIYNFSSSLISNLSLFSLGLIASYTRFYTLKKKDGKSVDTLNGLYLLAYSFLAILVLISGFVISTNVTFFLNQTYSANDIQIVKILTFILTINLAVSFPMNIFMSYVVVNEKFVFLKSLTLIKTVLSPFFSLVALFLGFGSVGLVVTTVIVSVTIDLINVIFCFKKLKISFRFKDIDFKEIGPILKFSIFIAINNLVNQLNWEVDKVIIGKYLNSTSVSLYSIGSIINSYFVLFGSAVSSFFVPKINRIACENSPDSHSKLSKIFVLTGKFQFLILGLPFLGFIFFGKSFLQMWAGNDFTNSYYVALLLYIPGMIPLIQSVGIEIQRAKNKHMFRSIAYLIMAIVNVSISIILCKYFGIYGCAFGTSVSILVCDLLIMNIYYSRVLKIDVFSFWKTIFRNMLVFIVPICIGLLFINQPINSFFDFIRIVFAFTAVYIVNVRIFCFKKDEINTIKRGL